MALASSRSPAVLAVVLLLVLMDQREAQASREACNTCKCTLHFYIAFQHNNLHTECTHRYVKQPPEDVACDPYSSDSTGISLRCQVVADAPSSSYDVNWYHIWPGSTMPVQITTTSSAKDSIINSSTTSVVTTTLTLQLRVTGASPGPGMYYCQVELMDTAIETIPSDKFMLYDANSDHYAPIVQCDIGVARFKDKEKCAVVTDVANSSTAKMPVTTDSRTEVDINSNTAIRTAGRSTSPDTGSTTIPGGEGGSNTIIDPSSIVRYMILAYVLAPVALIIAIVLLVIGVVYACKRHKLHQCEEQKRDTEENRNSRCMYNIVGTEILWIN